MTTLVPMMAPACHSGEVLSRNGYDGMICSQNRTPVTKKLACMSQMCTSWFSSAASNRAGMCHTIMTALKDNSAVQGLRMKRPTVRKGVDHRASKNGTPDPAAHRDRQAVEQWQPRRAGHDQDGSEEGDQDVLDHVHEEVVVGPVVDG